ncbi:hypothetical protein E2C01_084946 [Portunus trituberculatus]|uniref:Uncharacterized protein n=1 Tax=Portunus trituberculatus TaxID=210409 RepID=A0A5B7IZM6_PORTR|nr:hypothetical protein [Portunus trituberculatus]
MVGMALFFITVGSSGSRGYEDVVVTGGVDRARGGRGEKVAEPRGFSVFVRQSGKVQSGQGVVVVSVSRTEDDPACPFLYILELLPLSGGEAGGPRW